MVLGILYVYTYIHVYLYLYLNIHSSDVGRQPLWEGPCHIFCMYHSSRLVQLFVFC